MPTTSRSRRFDASGCIILCTVRRVFARGGWGIMWLLRRGRRRGLLGMRMRVWGRCCFDFGHGSRVIIVQCISFPSCIQYKIMHPTEYTTHQSINQSNTPNKPKEKKPKRKITAKPPQHQPTQAQTRTTPPQKRLPQTKHPSKRLFSTHCHPAYTPSNPPPQSPHHPIPGKTHPRPSPQTGKPRARGRTQRPRSCPRSRRGSLCWIAGRGFRQRGRGGRRLGSGGL